MPEYPLPHESKLEGTGVHILSAREAALYTQLNENVRIAVQQYLRVEQQLSMADERTFDDARIVAVAEQAVVAALAEKQVTLRGYPESASQFSEFIAEYSAPWRDQRNAA